MNRSGKNTQNQKSKNSYIALLVILLVIVIALGMACGQLQDSQKINLEIESSQKAKNEVNDKIEKENDQNDVILFDLERKITESYTFLESYETEYRLLDEEINKLEGKEKEKKIKEKKKLKQDKVDVEKNLPKLLKEKQDYNEVFKLRREENSLKLQEYEKKIREQKNKKIINDSLLISFVLCAIFLGRLVWGEWNRIGKISKTEKKTSSSVDEKELSKIINYSFTSKDFTDQFKVEKIKSGKIWEVLIFIVVIPIGFIYFPSYVPVVVYAGILAICLQVYDGVATSTGVMTYDDIIKKTEELSIKPKDLDEKISVYESHIKKQEEKHNKIVSYSKFGGILYFSIIIWIVPDKMKEDLLFLSRDQGLLGYFNFPAVLIGVLVYCINVTIFYYIIEKRKESELEQYKEIVMALRFLK